MDETSRQLIGEVRPPIPVGPGNPALVDHEYVRNGVAAVLVEVEPLAGRRQVEVGQTRTSKDWARFIQGMLDQRYPQATKVRLVLDNLNIHEPASLYAAFPPAQARRLSERLEIHHTPRHGSWLNIAEIELSALTAQCLRPRTPTIEQMRAHVVAWLADRNHRAAPVHWRFTTDDARIKLASLYPKL